MVGVPGRLPLGCQGLRLWAGAASVAAGAGRALGLTCTGGVPAFTCVLPPKAHAHLEKVPAGTNVLEL